MLFLRHQHQATTAGSRGRRGGQEALGKGGQPPGHTGLQVDIAISHQDHGKVGRSCARFAFWFGCFFLEGEGGELPGFHFIKKMEKSHSEHWGRLQLPK